MNLSQKIFMATLLFSSSFRVLALPELNVRVDRNMTCKDGSIMGTLYLNGHQIGRTLELPFRNNEQSISSIPAGVYDTLMRNDGNRSWRIQLKNVPNREYIQLHVGNFQSQIEGCILLGDDIGDRQCMVTESRKTMEKLRSKIEEASDLGNMTSQVKIVFQIE